MGRPYAKELEALSETYDWAVKTPIDNISEFVKRSTGLPLYVIGSGGSLSAAAFASLLHQQTGTISKCLTPLEFLEFDNIDSNCAILIITAGGNNKDILATFDRAVNLGPKFLGALCASSSNRLICRAATDPAVFIHAARPPTGRDGFLATNSLLATEVWLARAYAASFSFFDKLPDSLPYGRISEKEFEEDTFSQLQVLKGKDTIVILYDNWGKAAAIDAESKLAEAGLVNVQLADYRNFAHGRHNWLDKNRQMTGLVALVTPGCAKMAAKTLRLIPKYIPTVEMSSDLDGPAASLSLLVKMMYVVKFFGKIRKIDPGRPQVALFGRKIYSLPIPENTLKPSNREQVVLRRKFPNFATEKDLVVQRVMLLRRFIRSLENARFGGIIFDYDGTLCDSGNRFKRPSRQICTHLTKLLQNGILVGVATGRGKSVRSEMQRAIPRKHWPGLLVGYYNGADIGYLDDDSKPDSESPVNTRLELFFEIIEKNNVLPQNCTVDKRPLQISIQCPGITVEETVSKINALRLNHSIRIVESSHSIDILAEGVSKLNLFNRMKELVGGNNLEILCIGDKGRWPGNDFEILRTKYSIGVDETSEDADSCWNTTPTDIKGEKAVLWHLGDMEIHDGYFALKLRMGE